MSFYCKSPLIQASIKQHVNSLLNLELLHHMLSAPTKLYLHSRHSFPTINVMI